MQLKFKIQHFAAISALALSAGMAYGSQEIVGSWYVAEANDVVMFNFLADGRYLQSSIISGDAAHTGIEWGYYNWNEVSGEIAATSVGDTNGDWGLANDVDGAYFVQVNGNTMTGVQPGCSDCGASLSRLITGNSPIVGSWLYDLGFATHLSVTTMFDSGFYIHARVQAGDAEHTGIEWGTYSWNAGTGEISAVSLGDTNGGWGLAGDTDGNQYVLVNGNTAQLFQPGCDDCSGQLVRIMPVPEPETYALMLAGLGLVGFAARRRKLD